MPHWRSFLDVEARGGRYLPWKEVARATGLSRTTAWRLQKRDDFPAPYAISPGRVGYREGEVEAWCVSRGHSTGRSKPQSAAGDELGRPAATTDRVPPSARPASIVRAAQAELRAAPASPPQIAPRGRVDPSPKRAKPGRRRSEHARAIAQQMLFDF
jgi:prophage regulatory protein